MMLLAQMIQECRLNEFIAGICEIKYQEEKRKQDEKIHQMQWEYWLHRIFDMDFNEYLETVERTLQPEASVDDIEATVKFSYEMMENFHPE